MATILIAEDEAHVLRVMALWLGRNGHTVLEARHGGEALEVLRRERVDLLLTDVAMPVLDGIALVRTVRDDLGLGIPIVMLSARCDYQRIGRDIEPYGVRFFPKPFVPSALVAEIDRLLQTVPTER